MRFVVTSLTRNCKTRWDKQGREKQNYFLIWNDREIRRDIRCRRNVSTREIVPSPDNGGISWQGTKVVSHDRKRDRDLLRVWKPSMDPITSPLSPLGSRGPLPLSDRNRNTCQIQSLFSQQRQTWWDPLEQRSITQGNKHRCLLRSSFSLTLALLLSFYLSAFHRRIHIQVKDRRIDDRAWWQSWLPRDHTDFIQSAGIHLVITQSINLEFPINEWLVIEWFAVWR